jgi:hypothetical protein
MSLLARRLASSSWCGAANFGFATVLVVWTSVGAAEALAHREKPQYLRTVLPNVREKLFQAGLRVKQLRNAISMLVNDSRDRESLLVLFRDKECARVDPLNIRELVREQMRVRPRTYCASAIERISLAVRFQRLRDVFFVQRKYDFLPRIGYGGRAFDNLPLIPPEAEDMLVRHFLTGF